MTSGKVNKHCKMTSHLLYFLFGYGIINVSPQLLLRNDVGINYFYVKIKASCQKMNPELPAAWRRISFSKAKGNSNA